MTVRLETNEPALFGELADVIRIFYPTSVKADEGDFCIRHEGGIQEDRWQDRFYALGFEHTYLAPRRAVGELAIKRERKRAAKTGLFLLLKMISGQSPAWGSLTGIRPTRLLYERLEAGDTPAAAALYLREKFFVSEEKAGLLKEIERMQRGLRTVPPGQFDLYIGIPFCPTRCAYCSFSSGELGDGRLVEPYLAALSQEIRACGAMMREMGLSVRAAYMGGGTPTSLGAAQLARVLDEAQAAFPGAREWTVEAGRPDSITMEKLRAIRERGVERVCVNPQTFSDETLRRIGRAHTARETIAAYQLAREVGFADINMDLIAALPGETLEDFRRTLETTVSLAPESVTVHALAIKRSSRLHEQMHVQGGGHGLTPASEAEQMTALARKTLTAGGWKPYYLYRQKYMAGNLENVGYARPGMACLYNIGNMEETASVLALGAGAITKWLFDRARRIERAPNVKNIEAYIERVEEMAARKRALIFS